MLLRYLSLYICISIHNKYIYIYIYIVVVQSLSYVWFFVTPMDCSMPSFPVLHCFPEFAQTHVHWVDDAIQTYHSLSSPSPSALNQSFPGSGSLPMTQLFASGGQSIRASILPMSIQGWFPKGLTALISLMSKRLSRVFSNTTVQKHQFFGTQPSLWSNSHIHTRLLEKP